MLQWIDIRHGYGGKTVAAGLSLSVAAGEIVAVLGASGSGKSTLLNIAAGLVRPQHGRVLFQGEDYTFRQPERRRFALMFQDYALLPHLNVWQNVAFGLRLQGHSRHGAAAAARAMLAQVGLANEAERPVHGLSGGEQQRVALARALVVQPRALLLDEPFSALDSQLRTQLQRLTLDLLRRHACPAVLVTHSPREALYMADRVCLLADGRWLQQGTPAELMMRPASAAAARLLACDNVDETRYIPQHALHADHPQGQDSLLTAAYPQAGVWQLVWQHPQHGLLTQWRSGAAHMPQVGDTCRLWVDEAAVVRFQAA